MTATIISLLSVLFGILGANIWGVIKKKYSFGLTGNTLAGVFGGVFLVKSFGRLGFSPNLIIQDGGEVSLVLLFTNLLVSFVGGVLLVIILKKIYTKMNNLNLEKEY